MLSRRAFSRCNSFLHQRVLGKSSFLSLNARRKQGTSVCERAAASLATATQKNQQEPPAQTQIQGKPQQQAKAGGRQTVDFSTLFASAHELRQLYVPAKVEQVLMSDKTTLMLRLRTAALQTAWLLISWHPVAGRVGISSQPPSRGVAAEAYQLGDVVSSNLSGLVLTGIEVPQEWERVLQLQFGLRHGGPPTRCLYCEIMSRFSNIILTKELEEIVACGYQVGHQMSSLRQLKAGSTYQPPPVTSGVPPDSCGSMEEWRDIVVRASSLAAEKREQRKRTPDARSLTSTGTGNNPHSGSGSSTSGIRNNTSSSNSNTNSGCNPSMAINNSTPAAAYDGSVVGSTKPPRGQFAEGILRAFQGTSPGSIGDLWLAAGLQNKGPGLPGTADVDSLLNTEWEALWRQWQVWLDRLKSSSYTASSDDSLTRYSVVWDGSNVQHLNRSHESVLSLLDAYYGEMQGDEQHARLHQQLQSTVQGLKKKVSAKIQTFESQLADAAKVASVQKLADIITANIYRIPPGAKEVECEDWDTGETVTVALNPTKTAVEASKDYYKRARKLRRASDAVTPLLEAAHEELAYIDQVLESLQQLEHRAGPEDERALREVQEELISGGYLKPPPDAALAAKAASKARKVNARASKKGGKAAASPDGSSGLRSFVSPRGYQILVGRNNKQNDILSHSVAQPEDLWFHLRGRPGSHVALRVGSMPGRQNARPEIGDEDVQYAADLAAYFSKGRNDLKCDVIVAIAGGLKKPKGARPGQVLVTKELGNVVARPGNISIAVKDSSGSES